MKLKSSVGRLSVILALQLACFVGLVEPLPSTSCSAASTRYCVGSVFKPDFDYQYMEGNVPLGMLAVFFIETSSTAANLIRRNGAASSWPTVDKVRRIRRIW